jgi:ketosteroid isomerase-like protein
MGAVAPAAEHSAPHKPRRNTSPVPNDDVDVVRRAIDAWNRRDLEAALELTHPQCESRSVQATETAYGREGVAATFRDWFEAFEDFQMEPEDFIVSGDRILVPMRQRARGEGSGLQIDERFYQLYTVRDGMIIRFDEYSDEEQALQAAGLSRQR